MLNRVTTWIIFAELMLFLAWASRTHWTPIKGVGAAAVIVSAVLLLAARVELGRSFTVRCLLRGAGQRRVRPGEPARP